MLIIRQWIYFQVCFWYRWAVWQPEWCCCCCCCQRESRLQTFTFLSFRWPSLPSPCLSFSVKVTSSLYKTAAVAASSSTSLAAAGVDKQSQSLLPPGLVRFLRAVTSLRLHSCASYLPPLYQQREAGLEMLPAGGWHDGRATFRLRSILLPFATVTNMLFVFHGRHK